MTDWNELPSLTEPVPLFPLPNVVLLPGGTLSLQIFEPRYRAMMRDVLTDDGVMAMALLRPGYQAYYHTNLAEIHQVVCVGRVREHIHLPDDRYLINLVGACRARVRQEDTDGEYRLATVDAMINPPNSVETDGEYGARHELAELLSQPVLDIVDHISRARKAVQASAPLSDVTDIVAATVLPQEFVEVRQRLLEEMRVLRRVDILRNELRVLLKSMEVRQQQSNTWPRFGSSN